MNEKKKLMVILCTFVVSIFVIASIIGSAKQQPDEIAETSTQSNTPIPKNTLNISTSDSHLSKPTNGIISTAKRNKKMTKAKTTRKKTKATKLFKKIYVPYATRKKPFVFSGVKTYIKNSGFKYKLVSPSKSKNGTITVYSSNGDYVFFSFHSPISLDVIMTVSYYQKKTNREISLDNYSTNNSASYDALHTHIIGKPEKEVDSIDDQKAFLLFK